MKALRIVGYMAIVGLTLFGCRKDPPLEVPTVEAAADWEKFLGDYKVYDTLGVYLYDMSISHHSGINGFGVEVDSLLLSNFADTFDLDIKFKYKSDDRILDIGINHPAYDHSGWRWHLSHTWNDPATEEMENTLIGDTILLAFTMDNIAFYWDDGVSYFTCECRQLAVKQ